MASAGEDENAISEQRRTRSGRVVMSSPVAPRSKRSKKQLSQEQLNKLENFGTNEEMEEEITSKAHTEEEEEQTEVYNNNNNTNNGEEANKDSIENDVTEQSEENVNYNDENDNNYNEYAEQEQTEIEEDVEMYDEEQNNIEVPTAAEAGIDDKSSSFPFGAAAGQSESSEEAQNEEDTSGEKSAVDGSLLASLAGDNANSLPSVGGGDAELDTKKEEDFSTTEVISSESTSNREKLDTDDSLSEPAIAESIAGATDASDATIVNTEIISEDELPLPTKPEINDAEEVSDDELPAPQRAELPADAEVISEDELPPNADKKSPGYNSPSANKKRKAKESIEVHNDLESTAKVDSADKKPNIVNTDEQYNPMSPTSESDDSAPTEKKPKLENDAEQKEKRRENDKEKDKDKEKEKEKSERKRLPDLDKYWRPVKEDPADFTGWTYLLQYVDNESDAEAAREAYDAFLAQYPYCYGYWRKYADFEKRKGIKANCNVVFERGLDAIPLSVDLWIHYLTHVKNTQPDDEEFIRSQFERAVNACGLEFRSDKLWDAYIKWETDAKHFQHVFQIYDRLLAIPTQGYSGHFDNFQDLINHHALTSVLPEEELRKLRLDVHEAKLLARNRRSTSHDTEETAANDVETTTNKTDEADAAETTDGTQKTNSSNNVEQPETTKEDLSDLSTLSEDEINAIRSRLISLRRKVHKITVAAVTARWSFEEGIKRPYFHVKPLERCQLKNWKDYLDFEIERGDRKRILVLFERCLIACALYDEFWLKMIRYLESETEQADNVQVTRDIFRRACEIHHPDKPSLHLMWAAFEECQNNFDRAAEVLVNLERKVPNLLQVTYRRINVERRRGDLSKCRELYEHYISNSKNKTIAGSMSIKYARFLNKICNDLDGGLVVLQHILEKDPANTRVALQMIDLALQRATVNENEIVDIMDQFMSREGIDPEQKVLFAQRKVEFLEDFGSTAKGLQNAQRTLQLALGKANDAKKKRESSPSRKSVQGSNASSGANAQANSGYNSVGAPAGTGGTNYNYANAANSAYYGQSGNGGGYQQSYDNYYNHWQYGSSGYSGYGQWGGYGNYY